MSEVAIYFEVQEKRGSKSDFALPCGIRMVIGESKKEIDYKELAESITQEQIDKVAEVSGIRDIFGDVNLCIITPEEYEEKYGDE